jgi:hypothetical protein
MHLALSDSYLWDRKCGEDSIPESLSALIVAKVVVSLSGISHRNFENESTHTNIMALPALLRGNFPT